MSHGPIPPATFLTFSSATSEKAAVTETIAALKKLAGRAPIRGGVLYHTVGLDAAKLRAALASSLPDVPLLGATSCHGVGSTGGHFTGGLAGWWLVGDGFRFGVAAAPKVGDREHLGAGLAERALQQGGFGATACRFAIFHATPGDEELLLAGVHRQLDPAVALIGGTAADDDLSGKWMVWTHEMASGDAAALAVCDWPWRIAVNYEPGYLPTKKRGTVTSARGRTLLTIDGQPAARVYDEWTAGGLGSALEDGGTVLAQTTLSPLGVPRGRYGGIEAFVLAHPERVNLPERSLSLFAAVKEGEEVVLMTSSEESLVRRSAKVAETALGRAELAPADLVGGLLVYCAGCMLAIERRMPDMLAKLEGKVGKIPYVGYFSFGEQGAVLPRMVDHGNLMASVLLLSRS